MRCADFSQIVPIRLPTHDHEWIPFVDADFQARQHKTFLTTPSEPLTVFMIAGDDYTNKIVQYKALGVLSVSRCGRFAVNQQPLSKNTLLIRQILLITCCRNSAVIVNVGLKSTCQTNNKRTNIDARTHPHQNHQYHGIGVGETADDPIICLSAIQVMSICG